MQVLVWCSVVAPNMLQVGARFIVMRWYVLALRSCVMNHRLVMTGIMMYLYIQKTIVRNAAQPEFLSMSSCSMLCTATAFIKEALSRSVCASVLCIYVCMFMYRCMCMLMCKCMCICMYVCIYIYRYMYMYMYMYMYIHTMICNCRVSVNAAACDGKPHGHCSSGLMLPEPPILGATAANCFV